MDENIKQLKDHLAEIVDLGGAAALLGWDQETYMPPGATEDRSMQLATLNRIIHEKFTRDEIGELIEKLKPEMSSLDPDSDEARLVKNVKREYEKQRKVPSGWVAEFSRATSIAQESWKKARQKSEFNLFQPNLTQVLDLRRQYAQFFIPYDHIYDPLLDDFEPGMKTADVKKVFDELRPRQVQLVQSIMDSPYPVDDSILHQEFDMQKQWDFGLEVIEAFGFNLDRGRQDKSTHPFTTSFGSNDVRITTRLKSDFLSIGLFSTLHEAGHGLYEQGFSPNLSRTPLADGASLSIHESQSRMWENLVGRSRPFWIGFFPRLQEYFPDQLGDVDLETFYRAINKVERSLIRTEADEATYNLHIMLRFELELALMEQLLDVADLPEVWNAKMEEYLGITPANDADGVLQDIHWSFGIFGYFSTYCLGNLIASMFWEKILSDIPDLEKQFEAGKFEALLKWLQENILQHGSKFEPAELIQRVIGSQLTAEPYVKYLTTKFGDIYRL
jgi:carboxypeptidase Taq